MESSLQGGCCPEVRKRLNSLSQNSSCLRPSTPSPCLSSFPRGRNDTDNWIEIFKGKIRQMNLHSKEGRRRTMSQWDWLGILSCSCWGAAVISGHGCQRQITTLGMEGSWCRSWCRGQGIRQGGEGWWQSWSPNVQWIERQMWFLVWCVLIMILVIISYLTGDTHLSSYVIYLLFFSH